ncbi:unnamed protein product [Allacma fusca]|uniref:Uncharacterized protein n=1 Tax=Allacma fusca TaxID=39272 RepID=A0A8J2JY54_9HEXA|nr:unnamed protein product [Allacma fusca]
MEWYSYEKGIYMQDANMYRKSMKKIDVNLQLYDDWTASHSIYKELTGWKYQEKTEELRTRISKTFFYWLRHGLTSIAGVYITTGLDHLNGGRQRMQTLLENCILWLWDRQQRASGASANEGYYFQDHALEKPLSFMDSDVHLIFYVFIFDMSACTLSFVGEAFLMGTFNSRRLLKTFGDVV